VLDLVQVLATHPHRARGRDGDVAAGTCTHAVAHAVCCVGAVPDSTWHAREREAARVRHAVLEGHSRTIGAVRVVCVCVVIGVLVVAGLGIAPPRVAWGALVAASLFAALVVVHGRVDRERDQRQAAIAFHDHALTRPHDAAAVEQSVADNGANQHPYQSDLDVTGDNSVYAFVSFAQTRPGARTLASWLLAGYAPPPIDEIRARQAAAQALALKPDFARALWVAGVPIHRGREKAVAFEWWAIAKQPFVIGGAARVFAWVWPPVTIATLIAGHMLGWPAMLTWGPYAVAVTVSLALRPRVGQVAAAVVAHEGGAVAFASAFDAALTQRFDDVLLERAQKDVEAGRDALRALRSSTRALEMLQNEVFRLLIAPIVLAELHAVAALERWRGQYGAAAPTWFAAYGTIEAVASLGMLGHDFPAFAWPELTTELRFEAKGLGHPLVPGDKCVRNDVGPLEAGNAIVVTGSNMSGKSTLLRSMGVAAAMAAAGGPVCADKLVVGPVRLVTSMRVADSLAEGASRFYAELRRLKVVTDMAAQGPGVLFLLDEILYGTNARERLIGSRATLAWLLEHGALGAVSTHDLMLASLEGALASHARNVHFEEQVVGDAMTFDYKLRDGVVQSSNALRLMKELGLPVEGEH